MPGSHHDAYERQFDEWRNMPGENGEALRLALGVNRAHFAEIAAAEAKADRDRFEADRRLRNNIFLKKLRRRSRLHNPPSSGSSLISEEEFSSTFAAAEFAHRQGWFLDTSVTLAWSRMGLTQPAEVQAALTNFLKCLNGWLGKRCTAAFVYCHEVGPVVGLHTHFAVWVPAEDRAEFKAWAKAWLVGFCEKLPDEALASIGMQRPSLTKYRSALKSKHSSNPRYGQPPGALRVRSPSKVRSELHWRLVNYLLKGIDTSVIVQSAELSPSGEPVRLGDLVCFALVDPGGVPMERRISSSVAIGKSARHAGLEGETPRANSSANPFALEAKAAKRTPFKSRYEYGARSVLDLYPADFLETLGHPTNTPNPPIACTGDDAICECPRCEVERWIAYDRAQSAEQFEREHATIGLGLADPRASWEAHLVALDEEWCIEDWAPTRRPRGSDARRSYRQFLYHWNCSASAM